MGDETWTSEKTDWPDVGVNGRSCETKLFGDVGRRQLYRSVIRLCIMRALSASVVSRSRIWWMRARKWAMPSSAGSDSDMASAFCAFCPPGTGFALGKLWGFAVPGVAESDESRSSLRSCDARARERFDDMAVPAGTSMGVLGAVA